MKSLIIWSVLDSNGVDSVLSIFGDGHFKYQLFIQYKCIKSKGISKLFAGLWTANNSAPFGSDTLRRHSNPIKMYVRLDICTAVCGLKILTKLQFDFDFNKFSHV